MHTASSETSLAPVPEYQQSTLTLRPSTSPAKVSNNLRGQDKLQNAHDSQFDQLNDQDQQDDLQQWSPRWSSQSGYRATPLLDKGRSQTDTSKVDGNDHDPSNGRNGNLQPRKPLKRRLTLEKLRPSRLFSKSSRTDRKSDKHLKRDASRCKRFSSERSSRDVSNSRSLTSNRYSSLSTSGHTVYSDARRPSSEFVHGSRSVSSLSTLLPTSTAQDSRSFLMAVFNSDSDIASRQEQQGQLEPQSQRRNQSQPESQIRLDVVHNDSGRATDNLQEPDHKELATIERGLALRARTQNYIFNDPLRSLPKLPRSRSVDDDELATDAYSRMQAYSRDAASEPDELSADDTRQSPQRGLLRSFLNAALSAAQAIHGGLQGDDAENKNCHPHRHKNSRGESASSRRSTLDSGSFSGSADATTGGSAAGSIMDDLSEADDGDNDEDPSARARAGGNLPANVAHTSTDLSQSSTGEVDSAGGTVRASRKKNNEFHTLFSDIPTAEKLIEVCSCAWQKDILVQGRLFVSEEHVCFYSNILGWVNSLQLRMDEILRIRKRSTAVIFPNAIEITTQQTRYLFASLMSRDSTFSRIDGRWTQARNNHRSSTVQDAARSHSSRSQTSSSASESDTQCFDNREASQSEHLSESAGNSAKSGEKDGLFAAKVVSKLLPTHNMARPATASSDNDDSVPQERSSSDARDEPNADATMAVFKCVQQAPRMHAATTAPGRAFERHIKASDIGMPLPEVFEKAFGNDSGWITRFLEVREKVLNLQVGKWEEKDGKPSRKIMYVKQLNAPIGPKQTSCNIEERILHADFDNFVEVETETASPDVPTGGNFTVMTKFILTWSDNNATNLSASCRVNWTKSSWLKSAVEKGAVDGQTGYTEDLIAELQSEISGEHKSMSADKRRRTVPQHRVGRKKQRAQGSTRHRYRIHILGVEISWDSRVSKHLMAAYACIFLLLLNMLWGFWQRHPWPHRIRPRSDKSLGLALPGYDARKLAQDINSAEEDLVRWLSERTETLDSDETNAWAQEIAAQRRRSRQHNSKSSDYRQSRDQILAAVRVAEREINDQLGVTV